MIPPSAGPPTLMTLDETIQVLSEVARLVGAGIVGGLIGSYATHRFTLRRERDKGRSDREREFRSFVVEFRSAAEEGHFLADGSHPHPFSDFYLKKKPELRSAAAKITDDLRRNRRAEFDRLVNVAAGFNGEQARDRKGIANSLDAILKFLNTA